jgi:hypothetical protein
MTHVTEKDNLEIIKKENEMIIMKTFGVEYEKFFPQEHQCEK